MLLGMLFNVSMWYKLSGKTNMALWITLAGLAVTIIVNVAFMPKFSFWAAAFGHLASYLVMFIISAVLGAKYYPIPYDWKRILSLMLSMALICAATIFIDKAFFSGVGIGVSSAGDYIDNEPRVASLFIKVPRENWDKVKTIYTRAAAAIGDVPLVVANDGVVSALAGAIGLDAGKLMGLAMGTSEAVGYVDADKNVLGWINELAFAPVDLQAGAMQDEWSTDFGVGCKYFSQDAVIKLAPAAGIDIPGELSLAEKLKFVQKLMEADDPRAQAIFETIGAYFAYTMVLYSQFYDLDYMMLMGRVMSGKGGDTILKVCNDILAEEYPALAAKCKVTLPDEKMRRVGQAVAAASLPKIQ